MICFKLKLSFTLYKSLYSFFALINLVIVLYYHFSIRTVLLWNAGVIEKVISIVGIITGLSIMLLFTKRFFFDLSGADIFKSKPAERILLQNSFYKYVRHPLYGATLLFIWCIFLFKPMLSNLITCSCITIYTVIGIYFEERKLINEFGEHYKKYSACTPMLIPDLF